jgi:hypothetical protein
MGDGQMDPRACFDRIMASEDPAEVLAGMGDLLLWLLKGGHVPTLTADELARFEDNVASLADSLDTGDDATVEG